MKRLTLILLLISIACSSFAEVSFTVQIPGRVREGEKFPVTYRLKNAEGSNPKVGVLEGCTLLMGPSVSTSHSMQIINGQTSQSSTVDYTYYYRADKAGTVKVPEASISAGGKTLRTKATEFTIVAAQQQQQSQQNRQVDIYDPSTQSSDKSVKASDVFVRIILGKTSVFEQEAVECTIKLYTKYGINSFIPTKQPMFDNFLIEELDVSNQMNVEETYNGGRYMTAVLKKCILFPQKTGTLKINSGNYDVTVIQYDNINMGLFQVQQPRERQIKISSNSAELNVKPFPEPRPAGFDGATGTFTAETHLVGDNFKSGEPGSLMLSIKGTGNIKYLHTPEIDFPSQFETYTPTSDIKASVSGNNITGTMNVDYTFVPQTSGEFTIPSLPFVYFNPATASYHTIDLPAYNLKVGKGRTVTSVQTPNEIDAQVKDIRFISKDVAKSLSKSQQPVIYTTWYWIMILSPIVILALTVVIARKRGKLRADISGQRVAKANKVARKRLKAAHSAMMANNTSLFYDEMLRALWGYFSDKLLIPLSSLSRDNILEELTRYGISESTAHQAVELIDDCEMAKYAGSATALTPEQIYNRGTRLIDEVERPLKTI